MDKNVYPIVRTPYHLFLTILFIENGWFSEKISICYDSSKNAESIQKSIELLKKHYPDVSFIPFDDSRYFRNKRAYIVTLLRIVLGLPVIDLNVFKGDNPKFLIFVSSFYEVQTYKRFKNSSFILGEDGEALYSEFKSTGLREFVKRFLFLGTNSIRFKIAREIWCQFPERIVSENEADKRNFSLGGLMRGLSTISVYDIMNIFGITDDVIDTLRDKKDKVLILTQCFSENNAIAEDVKIKYYKDLVNEYSLNRQVFIKPHPREITDYCKLFPNVTVIPKNFPIEILNYIPDLFFETGLTINSSSIENCIFVKNKIYIGYEKLPELKFYYSRIKK